MCGLKCAGVDDSDIAAATVYRPLVSEEFKRVVKDFYGIGRAVQELVRGLVEAISLQHPAIFEHKIPVDALSQRMFLNNEFFIFTGHLDIL